MAKIYTNEDPMLQIEIVDPPEQNETTGRFGNFRMSHGTIDFLRESQIEGLEPHQIIEEFLDCWHDGPCGIGSYHPDSEVKLIRSRWYVSRRGSRKQHTERETVLTIRLGDTRRWQSLQATVTG